MSSTRSSAAEPMLSCRSARWRAVLMLASRSLGTVLRPFRWRPVNVTLTHVVALHSELRRVDEPDQHRHCEP